MFAPLVQEENKKCILVPLVCEGWLFPVADGFSFPSRKSLAQVANGWARFCERLVFIFTSFVSSFVFRLNRRERPTQNNSCFNESVVGKHKIPEWILQRFPSDFLPFPSIHGYRLEKPFQILSNSFKFIYYSNILCKYISFFRNNNGKESL